MVQENVKVTLDLSEDADMMEKRLETARTTIRSIMDDLEESEDVDYICPINEVISTSINVMIPNHMVEQCDVIKDRLYSVFYTLQNTMLDVYDTWTTLMITIGKSRTIVNMSLDIVKCTIVTDDADTGSAVTVVCDGNSPGVPFCSRFGTAYIADALRYRQQIVSSVSRLLASAIIDILFSYGKRRQ